MPKPTLRILPGKIAARDMNARQWSRFLSEAQFEFFQIGADGYNSGIGVWAGQDTDGFVKMFVGDENGHKFTFNTQTGVLTLVGDITVEDGSITADKIDVSELSAIAALLGDITAGTLTFTGNGSFLRMPAIGFDGNGIYLGYDAGEPAFSLRGGPSNLKYFRMKPSIGIETNFDALQLTNAPSEAGADRTVNQLALKGDSDTNAAVGRLLGSTVATSNNAIAGEEWQQLRSFQTDFTGSFRLMVEARRVDTLGAPPVNGKWRLKNGVGSVIHTESFSSTSFAQTFSVESSIAAAGEVWTMEGVSNTDLSTYTADTELRDLEVRARFNHATIT